MEDKFFDKLKEQVKATLGNKGSHDFTHTERVYNYSILISKGLNVNLDVVKASALLHDIARPAEDKGKVKDHAAQGAIDARKFLEKTSFPKEKIEIVCKCILLHNKKEDLQSIKEVRVLKEADGLETMGAIGIARAFSFLGDKYDWSNTSPNNPINGLSKNLNLDYFTIPAAKELAKEKLKITKDFCDSFIKEYKMGITN
jgi:uncharacterized protein